MLVNLTDVFTTEDKVVEKTVIMEQDVYCHQGEEIPILEMQPVKLCLKNNGQGKVIIDGHVAMAVLMNCDRCLKDVKQTIDFSFTRKVTEPDLYETESEEQCEFMEGFRLNVEDLICNEILINWPMKVLCKDDCKGICKVCGKNWNEGECECDTFVADPRMAVIKDIFNANKEV